MNNVDLKYDLAKSINGDETKPKIMSESSYDELLK